MTVNNTTDEKVTSGAGHGIRGKDAVIISDGTVSVSVSANMKKGITSDSLVCINGGSTVINVSGGAAYDSDDAEYKGPAAGEAKRRKWECQYRVKSSFLAIVPPSVAEYFCGTINQ